MSWSPHMDVHYMYGSYPYNSAGSFIEYFEGLTYEHVNFIFEGGTHVQESSYPTASSNLYKSGVSQPGVYSYYDLSHAFDMHDHESQTNEYRRHSENSATITNERTTVMDTEWEANESITHSDPVECLRRHHTLPNYQGSWQDDVDPDNMTYEELLELGESVGTQSRGLSQELISLLPISKYKCGLFSRKKSRMERCVICQMEYKRGDKRITLPCKHAYHASCGRKWLSINKACPICYKEVFAGEKR